MSVAGAPPRPDDPWPAYLLVAKNAGRIQARTLMTMMDGVAAGIGQAFGGGKAEARSARENLKRVAYPDG